MDAMMIRSHKFLLKWKVFGLIKI